MNFEYDGGATGAAIAKGKLTTMSAESIRTVFTYDAFGALASKSQYVTANGAELAHVVRYAYGSSGSANGHVTSMTYPSGSRINYSYDSSGRISGLTLNPGHLIGEYDTTSGKAAREIVYLGDTPVAVLQHVVSGTAPNQVHAVNVHHIFTDHLDTPRVIARASDNKVVWRWDSGDPFGVVQPIENPSGLGTFVFNLRMPGQYYDRATNLFHNFHRDYDPQTGRYVQSDPIGLEGGLNTYVYVGGNPVSRTDPTGLAWNCQPVGLSLICSQVPPPDPFESRLPPLPMPIDPWKDTNTETRIPPFCPPDGPDRKEILKNSIASCNRWFSGFIMSIPRTACFLAAQHAYKRCKAKTETNDGDPNGDGTTMIN